MSVPELSVQIKNAPGQMVQITAVLAEAGINIRAITSSSAGKVGWVRMIVDDSKAAAEALEECGIQVEPGEAVALALSNEPGSLDSALRALSDERINVDYVYTCLGDDIDKEYIILGVQSPGKAEKLLTKLGVRLANLDS